MSTVATLWVKLGLDSKDYQAGLSKAGAKTEAMAGKFKSVGASMMKTGAVATAALTLPIVAGLGKAVMAASDLEQSMGGVEAVFGDASDTLFAFGETAAQSVGLSKNAFNEVATVGGALLQNLGFSVEDAAAEVITLTERAADMAATFGGPVTASMGAIQSALKGEFNPLEQFGVKLNAADINARALALGLVETEVSLVDVRDKAIKFEEASAKLGKVLKDAGEGSIEYRRALVNVEKAQLAMEDAIAGSVGEIDNNAKAQAALAIIMEQTATVAGQFESEANTLAGQMERGKAEIENFAAQMGDVLLPIITKVVEGIGQLAIWFQNLSPEIKQAIVVALVIVAALGPLIFIFGLLSTAIGAVIPVIVAIAGFLSGPLLLPILAIIAAVALLAAAWKNNWGGIQDKVKVVVDFISGLLTAWWNKVSGIFEAGMAIIKMIFSAWSSAFSGDWTAFGEKVRQVWQMAWELVKRIFKSAGAFLLTTAKNIVTSIVGFFKNTNWKQVGINIVKGIGAGLKSMMGWIGRTARNVAKAAFDAAKGFLGIQSESKAFGELGKFSAMGFGAGFTGTMGKLQPAMNTAMVSGVNVPAVPGTAQSDMLGDGGKLDVKQLAREIRDVFLRETR